MSSFKERLQEFVKGAIKVAADIGSEKHYILIDDPAKRKNKVFSIPNTRKGFEDLFSRLIEVSRGELEKVVFGMESTGPYSDLIGSYLSERGIKVVQINGFHTKRLKELSDNSPLKSDLKDPTVIMDLMKLGHVMEFWRPEGPAGELRQLCSFREDLVQANAALLNKLRSELVIIFPEFEQAIGSVKSKTGLYLIKEGFHDPEKVKTGILPEQEILKISKGQKNGQTLEALREAAHTTVGLSSGKATLVERISWYAKQICENEEKIKGLERQMQTQLEQLDYSPNLLSIKGLGLVTVSAIIGEVGDFGRFRTVRELEKYAGLNLFEVSSGKFRGQKRISKRGRAYLRKILFITSLCQVRCNPPMKKKFEELKKKGKHSYSALTVIAKKLLRVCFALVRTRTEYDPAFASDESEELDNAA